MTGGKGLGERRALVEPPKPIPRPHILSSGPGPRPAGSPARYSRHGLGCARLGWACVASAAGGDRAGRMLEPGAYGIGRAAALPHCSTRHTLTAARSRHAPPVTCLTRHSARFALKSFNDSFHSILLSLLGRYRPICSRARRLGPTTHPLLKPRHSPKPSPPLKPPPTLESRSMRNTAGSSGKLGSDGIVQRRVLESGAVAFQLVRSQGPVSKRPVLLRGSQSRLIMSQHHRQSSSVVSLMCPGAEHP